MVAMEGCDTGCGDGAGGVAGGGGLGEATMMG